MAGADEAGQTAAQAPEQTPREGEPTTEQAVEQQAQAASEQTTEPAEPTPAEPTPGFGERGRMRRRARFMRKARELAYRDLGGLVFDLHRFGQRNDPLVLAKLATLSQIDKELRELEEALRDRRPVTVLREVGIAACPRCAAIHDSDDRFCPGCGLAFDAHADRPISTAPVNAQSHVPNVPAPAAPSPATGPLANQTSPLPSSAGKRDATEPATPPKVERSGVHASLNVEPAPVVRPTAAPVAAKPAAPSEPDREQEDEPTQILRPPAGGA